MADILVIKVNTLLKEKDFERLYWSIEAQRKHGLILLPPYCYAQVVPEDVKIVVEDSLSASMKKEKNNA